MNKEDISDLIKFMLPYPDSVKAASILLKLFVWGLIRKPMNLFMITIIRSHLVGRLQIKPVMHFVV